MASQALPGSEMPTHNRPRRHAGAGRHRSRRGSTSTLRRLLRLALLSYCAGFVILLAVVFGAGEAFWSVTFFLFGPRWAIALPLPVLAGLSALVDRRLGVVLTAVCVALLVPLLGFNIPWARLGTRGKPTDGPAIRVLTWNVGGDVEPGLGPLERVLVVARPDIAVLQECNEDRLDLTNVHLETPAGGTRGGPRREAARRRGVEGQVRPA